MSVKVSASRRCPACTLTFSTTDPRKVFCRPLCYKRWSAVYVLRYETCPICETLFIAHGLGGSAKGCSQACRHQLKLAACRRTWAKNYETTAKPLARKNTAIRRARLKNAQVEQFSHEEIFARDKYVCHLCGLKIDPKLKRPHPQAPELDHIVPLSLGGSHTRANVAAAHSWCNRSKHNSAMPNGEQLRLVG